MWISSKRINFCCCGKCLWCGNSIKIVCGTKRNKQKHKKTWEKKMWKTRNLFIKFSSLLFFILYSFLLSVSFNWNKIYNFFHLYPYNIFRCFFLSFCTQFSLFLCFLVSYCHNFLGSIIAKNTTMNNKKKYINIILSLISL